MGPDPLDLHAPGRRPRHRLVPARDGRRAWPSSTAGLRPASRGSKLRSSNAASSSTTYATSCSPHIHLDHAGAAGVLVREHPTLQVHVSEIGAPHLADPSRLETSARRLYGDTFDTLWGELAPVPQENIRIVVGIDVLGLDCFPTPGHASHHVSLPRPATARSMQATRPVSASSPERTVLPPTPAAGVRPRRRGSQTIDEIETAAAGATGARSTSVSQTEPARISTSCAGVSSTGCASVQAGVTQEQFSESVRRRGDRNRRRRRAVRACDAVLAVVRRARALRRGRSAGVASGPLRERNFRLLFAVARDLVLRHVSRADRGRVRSPRPDGVGDRTLGIAFACWTLAQVSTLLVGGVVADRLPRRLVMVSRPRPRTSLVRATMGALLDQRARADLGALRPAGDRRRCDCVLLAGVERARARARPGRTPADRPTPSWASRGTSAFPLGAAVGGSIVATIGSGYGTPRRCGDVCDVSAALLSQIRLGARRGRVATPSFVRELREGWQAFTEQTWIVAARPVWIALYFLVTYAPFFVLGPYIAKHSLGGAGCLGDRRHRRRHRRPRRRNARPAHPDHGIRGAIVAPVFALTAVAERPARSARVGRARSAPRRSSPASRFRTAR